MILTRCFDASLQIPKATPEHCGAVLGYIGGSAEHVWTLEEWTRFSHLRQFPCWVADVRSAAGKQAADAVAAARKLGWSAGRAIVADMESANDPSWWNEWSKAVTGLRYRPAWYGSESVSGGYDASFKWVALWDEDPQLRDGWAAKQYAANVTVPGGVVDLSVVDESLLIHGGRGARRDR
jgi:hypothetical protein